MARGPTPDPKTKLIVLLFLTLPHPVDCLSCVKDIMIIKFGDVVHLDEATGSRYHFFLCFVFLFMFFCCFYLFSYDWYMRVACRINCFWKTGRHPKWKLPK